ncbi:MAG: hypothetical protein R2800_04120 [Flavipsychrobacter sp.]
MLIFSGKGVVVPLVWMATAAVNGLAFNLKGADNAVITLMISGTICTVLGRRWRRQRLAWEEQHGMPSPKAKPSFFFVPVEHIWVLALVLILTIIGVVVYKGQLHW